MNKNNTIRIDKFLWAMRLCKTRKIAYHACNKRKIKINNITSKASKIIKIDDSIEYNKNYYDDRDIKPQENIYLKLTIMPFGQIASTPNLKK